MSLKQALAERLKERFSLDDVVDATESLLKGETVRKKFKVLHGKDGSQSRVLTEVVTTSRPEDRAKGLILLDAMAFGGELGMSPKAVQGGNMGDLYKRFNQQVDRRIVQLPEDSDG